MRVLMVLALMALPAQAEDCFVGMPKQVSYDDGHVITIIQHHGGDLTYTQPYEGYQDSVHKTHLMLFSKQARFGARTTENRWTSHLPDIGDLAPGYHFDLRGTMTSGKDTEIPYRVEGEVQGREALMVGKCSYDVLVITQNTYLDGALEITTTNYLSPDMMVVLRAKVLQIRAGTQTDVQAVAVQ